MENPSFLEIESETELRSERSRLWAQANSIDLTSCAEHLEFLLAVHVHSADIQDRDGAKPKIDKSDYRGFDILIHVLIYL